ncbi:MAG TPA: flavin-dependent oxidoreductase [Acetobacteraceae bacterium]|nr:flavin-dependent oxidoreductase [Acetobacteraceae bacterium]
MTVLIAGAGIGGLTAALSLHQIGVPVCVFESVRRIEPLGVGINLLPHAVRELTELGLGETIEASGVPTAELAYYSKHGQKIWSEPRGRAGGYRWPQISIHRGRLQMILLAAVRQRLGAEAVQTGRALTGWEARRGSVIARFADDEAAEGALLVGADGIHSTVRRLLYPAEGRPIWNGAILWRGTTEAAPFLGGRTMIMAGHEFQKFVCYPISLPGTDGRATLNWIAERKFPRDRVWRREDWNRLGVPAEFLPSFEGWRFDWLDVPALIRAGLPCHEYPMVDRDPLPRWSAGRVTLLGDAAHPMYPIGSNGASQAILDARVLAREIQAHGEAPEALAAYEAERRPATEAIVLANRRNGPEQVMQLVEARAPDGFKRIEDVLTAAELEETAAAYKRVAGFDKEALNARPPIVEAGR